MHKWLKITYAVGIVLAVALFILGAWRPWEHHPSPGARFKQDVHSAGLDRYFNLEDKKHLPDIGRAICQELSTGYSHQKAAETTFYFAGGELSLPQSGEFVHLAIRDMCPGR